MERQIVLDPDQKQHFVVPDQAGSKLFEKVITRRHEQMES